MHLQPEVDDHIKLVQKSFPGNSETSMVPSIKIYGERILKLQVYSGVKKK